MLEGVVVHNTQYVLKSDCRKSDIRSSINIYSYIGKKYCQKNYPVNFWLNISPPKLLFCMIEEKSGLYKLKTFADDKLNVSFTLYQTIPGREAL